MARTVKPPTPAAATAAAVRAAIRASRAAGTLAVPAEATVRVRTRDASTVEVDISGVDAWAGRAEAVMSAAARAAGDQLEAMIRQHRTAPHVWGLVTYDETTSLGGAPRAGWAPGQD